MLATIASLAPGPGARGNRNREGFAISTTIEQNKAMIRRFFDAWNGRQPDAFDDLIAPDVVRDCEATPGVEARNLDQIKEFLRQDTADFPILSNNQASGRSGESRRCMDHVRGHAAGTNGLISTFGSQGAI
jgi:ketosteroid isomerase-like protein